MTLALYIRKIDSQYQEHLERLKTLLETHHVEYFVLQAGSPLPPVNFDFLLTIGGDGTLLSAVHVIGSRRVPVIGVNFGHLGFLTTAGKEHLDSLVTDLVSGHYTVEERTLLSAHIGEEKETRSALNEVTFRRSEVMTLLSTDVFVNGQFVSTYAGDGVIVATPTGSTAYSLSCGGPILTPDSGCFVITPIAVHSLTLRPVIVPDTATITLRPHSLEAPAILSFDSTVLPMDTVANIHLHRADYTIPLVRLNRQNFFSALHEKLAL